MTVIPMAASPHHSLDRHNLPVPGPRRRSARRVAHPSPWLAELAVLVPATIAATYDAEVVASNGHLLTAMARNATGRPVDLRDVGINLLRAVSRPWDRPEEGALAPAGPLARLPVQCVVSGTERLHSGACASGRRAGLPEARRLGDVLAEDEPCARCWGGDIVVTWPDWAWERLWDLACLEELVAQTTTAASTLAGATNAGRHRRSEDSDIAALLFGDEPSTTAPASTLADAALAAAPDAGELAAAVSLAGKLAARVAAGDDLAAWAAPYLADVLDDLIATLASPWTATDPAVGRVVGAGLALLEACGMAPAGEAPASE